MNPEVATALAFAAADCPVWVCTSSRSDSPSSRFAFAPALSFSTRFFLPPNIGPIVGGGRRPRFELLPLAEPPRVGSHGRVQASASGAGGYVLVCVRKQVGDRGQDELEARG